MDILTWRVVEHLRQASYSKLAAIVIGLFSFLLFFRQQHPRVPGAKVHGYSSWFEPTFLLKIRFVTQAYNIIDSGYKKVRLQEFLSLLLLVRMLHLTWFAYSSRMFPSWSADMTLTSRLCRSSTSMKCG